VFVTADYFLKGGLRVFFKSKRIRDAGQAQDRVKILDIAGSSECAEQMAMLSEAQVSIRWKKHNIIVSHSKKIHNEMNVIRAKIEKMPSDIITLIPSARWLIDNFQLIYREIKKLNFSTTGYAKIPVLRSSPWKGLPRIYIIARKMVDLSGGYLNEENIITMINAYQEAHPLTDRELQILPEMLGLCLLEHILGVTRDITYVVDVKARADRFVKDKIEENQDYPDVNVLLTEGRAHRESIYFHSHVLYLLKSLSVEQESVLRYISFHFKDEWESIGMMDIFKEESRQESILESTIRNPIASLRELNELNEEEIFEELSAVERILSEDPDGVYPKMDSLSRAVYRDVVERLSVKFSLVESDISETCIKLAQRGDERLNNSHHVGTYLIGKGCKLMRETILKKKPSAELKEPTKLRGAFYFLFVGGMLCLLLVGMFLFLSHAGYQGKIGRIILFMLAALPVLAGISLKLANSLFTRGLPAKNLPAMDYTKGIPDNAKTLVVMPVIISSKEQGLEYVNRLQKHYLANRQNNLYFALLADYADAPEKKVPGDEEIRDTMISRVRELNGKSAPNDLKFSLFIRERRWNPSEGRFMCWERKRGKLEEFNRLLNSEKFENTSFEDVITNPEMLGDIHYVITLDADSDLVLDNASKLVGIIDHPLNRAIVDPIKKTVKEGYAIIQPHVMNHIIDTGNSLFQRIYSGKTGLPNYSMAVSDVYQDVFKSAIFIGKGIYNAKVFHQLLNHVIPENRVLSHDLLESCYAKTAFAGNAHIVESFPGSFASYAKRQHRWIRGDWQLLPWLHKKEISFLSKWKILDDLRSSLVPAGKMLFILLNILCFQKVYWLWMVVFAVPLAFDLLAIVVDITVHLAQGQRYVLLYRKLFREVGLLFTQFGFDLVFIPYEAYYSLDAILRTLYRYLVSKKNLLMWDSAEHVEKSAENSLRRYFSQMWPSFIAAAAVFTALSVKRLPWPGFFLFGILALSWGLSFFIAFFISRTAPKSRKQITPDMDIGLRETARRIWRFFRDFSLPVNNRLCPDNFQIGRREKLVNKTSPTNIGLQFLSALSALDLGFETLGSALDYIESLLHTVTALPKWQGHLFNWYNTLDLKTLSPHYVSTVDSGNFFGYMLTLKNGLDEMQTAPIVSKTVLNELKYLLVPISAVKEIMGNFETYGDFVENLVRIRQSPAHQPVHTSSSDMRDFVRLAEAIQQDIERFDLGGRMFSEGISLHDLYLEGNLAAGNELDRISGMKDTIERMENDANFGILFNPKRKLFYIGFNMSSQTYDQSCYDLIASESLLTSLLAIAKGDVPVNHWQRLGRPLTLIKGRPAHVSWSGTMFEYLMPHLVVKEFTGSVFDDSSKAAVLQQMWYARKLFIPWGMSESQYNRFDINQNYQYKAFGVPKLRLQPVYKDMQVISPYSTMLALEYDGKKGFMNLKALREIGAYGEYGFFEAVDFTVPDPVTLKNYCIVKSFMAHHQGMSILAIDNYLNTGIMRKRFHAAPMIKAAQTLLEEKHQSLFASPSRRGYTINFKKRDDPEDVSTSIRYVRSVNLPIPMTNHMSNGSYSVLLTSDGDGFSQRKDTMLYRWRPDIYADTGFYIYIRDTGLNAYWSAAHHPTKVKADKYQVVFSPHQSEFIRQDKGIVTSTMVTILPDYNLEIRKVKLKNISSRERQLEVTSYLEVTIDTLASESSHPVYNKLFVESEFLEDRKLFISKRRGGSGGSPYAMHMLQTEVNLVRNVEYESSRAKFIGRNNSLQNPQAVRGGAKLSNSTDYSGDSIMSIRACVSLRAGEAADITFISGLFESREAVINASDEFSRTYRIEDAVERFRQQSKIELKYLDMTGSQQRAFQTIIRQIYYPYRYFRGPDENIRRNWSGQNGLWKFSISGDDPIMLLHIKSAEEISLVRDVLKIYEYMGINMVKADLVILAEGSYGYASELTNMLTAMLSSLRVYENAGEKPGIHIIHSYELSPSEMDLIFTVANVVFSADSGIYFRKIQEAGRIYNLKESYSAKQ
jgi:cyclic beta-1,2-glucan synthetase